MVTRTDIRAMCDQSRSRVTCQETHDDGRLIFDFKREPKVIMAYEKEVTHLPAASVRCAIDRFDLERRYDYRDVLLRVADTARKQLDAAEAKTIKAAEKKHSEAIMDDGRKMGDEDWDRMIEALERHEDKHSFDHRAVAKAARAYDEWAAKHMTKPLEIEYPPASVSKKKAVTHSLAESIKKEEDAKMTGMTASETYDAISQALTALNENLMGSTLGNEYVAEIWAEVHNDGFERASLIEGERFRFERIIYSDRLDKLVFVMAALDGSPNLLVPVSVMEDAFSELFSHATQELVDLGCKWATPKHLEDDIKKLGGGRTGMKKALSEASYKAVEKAVVVKEEKKQAAREDFYASNPLYGMF